MSISYTEAMCQLKALHKELKDEAFRLMEPRTAEAFTEARKVALRADALQLALWELRDVWAAPLEDGD